MGRPLNKKYFGNRNIGTSSTTADDKIGGEGIASISTAVVGSFVVNNTRQNFPLLNIASPTTPDGVLATADVVFELDTVTYASGGATNYTAGLSTTITGLGGGAVVNITTNGGGAVNAVNLTGGNRGEFRRGDFTGSGITTHQVLKTGDTGTDLQITVTFRLKSITITEKGSGYTTVPSLSWGGHVFTGQTPPSGQTPVLTTDSGAVGSVTNQENAIIAYAWVSGSRVLVDIVKQEASRRYAVRTATLVSGEPWSVRSAILVGKDSSADGEMDITVVDSAGNSYWVTKLTAHKALLTRKPGGSGYLYATGAAAPWKLDAASGIYVQIVTA